MNNFLEKWSNQIIGIASVAGTIISAILVNIFSKSNESIITSRKLFENCYSPIYFLIERDLYSKSISQIQIINYANQIDEILLQSQPYFSPFIKALNETLQLSKAENSQLVWQSFSREFMHEFSRISKDIGLFEKRRKYYIPSLIPQNEKEMVSLVKRASVKRGNSLFIAVLIVLLLLIVATLVYMFKLTR